jgi:hypothetical protein
MSLSYRSFIPILLPADNKWSSITKNKIRGPHMADKHIIVVCGQLEKILLVFIYFILVISTRGLTRSHLHIHNDLQRWSKNIQTMDNNLKYLLLSPVVRNLHIWIRLWATCICLRKWRNCDNHSLFVCESTKEKLVASTAYMYVFLKYVKNGNDSTFRLL